ncbi:MAG: hypothetical protein K1X71_19540 [Pirellulales bacterium]|nr:hypothetical protein [Pirellulales bacterium]
MHAEWEYEAEGAEYQSAEQKNREYRQRRTPKLTNRKKKRAQAAPGPGLNRRRNKHWSW